MTHAGVHFATDVRNESRFTLDYATPGQRLGRSSRRIEPWVRDLPFVIVTLSVVASILFVAAFLAHWAFSIVAI